MRVSSTSLAKLLFIRFCELVILQKTFKYRWPMMIIRIFKYNSSVYLVFDKMAIPKSKNLS